MDDESQAVVDLLNFELGHGDFAKSEENASRRERAKRGAYSHQQLLISKNSWHDSDFKYLINFLNWRFVVIDLLSYSVIIFIVVTKLNVCVTSQKGAWKRRLLVVRTIEVNLERLEE